jgi:hypothetical protein
MSKKVQLTYKLEYTKTIKLSSYEGMDDITEEKIAALEHENSVECISEDLSTLSDMLPHITVTAKIVDQ